jgi:hypothetical protein
VSDGGVPRRRVAHGYHPHLGRHPLEVGDSSPHRTVGEDPSQSGGDCDLGRRLARDWRGRRIEQYLVNRRQLAKEPQEGDQFRGGCRAHGSVEKLCLEFARPGEQARFPAVCDTGKDVRGHLPGTWRRPGIRIRGGVGRVQQFGPEAEEGDDLRADPRPDRPLRPVVEIRFEVEMHEPVAQRPRHGEVNAALRGRIACGDHNPAIRQHILAELPVQDQLIAARLGHLRSRGQLVEKENAFACGGEKPGGHPFGPVFGDPRQAPKIDRVKLHGPHVEKVVPEIVGNLSNDLRLADAACAPDMRRHTFADQRMERLMDF